MTVASRRRALVTVVAGVLLGALALPALAQPAPELRLRDARLAPDGDTRLVVGVEGLAGAELDSGAFTVLEDGQEISGIEAELAGTDDVPLVVALAFDVSGSVAPVFDEIQNAGLGFVQAMSDQGVQVALVPFSSDVEVTVQPTSSAATLEAGIAGLEVGGGTALFDAIVTSSEVLEAAVAGRDDVLTQIVVFSDGEDRNSTSTEEAAILAAESVEAPITTVGWEADDFDPDTMARLAEATGGSVVSSEDAGDVGGLFQDVAVELGSLYTISYVSDIAEPSELPVTVIADTPAGEARVDSFAINARDPATAGPGEPQPSGLLEPRIALFAGPVGLWVGIAAAFLGALALLWLVLVRPTRTAGARSLERGLRIYDRGGRVKDEDVVLPTSRLTERAIDLVGRVPKPEGFDERLQLNLDRAAWPVRSNEFLVMVAASAALGGVLAGGIARNILVGVVGAVVAGAVPVLVMKLKIDRRRKAFMDHLPGTLQLLAGSLRAGYGLLQAIDTVVKEADDPTSTEFARVLTEARLGMPVDQALEGMAQRLDSDDFHWVVLAIGIQREVGGNLAELLTTVAATMRSRAQLRRQIRVLSAEGRISAWVIGAMPFVVALALQVLNPGYVGELFQRIEGVIMLLMAAMLLVAGGFWLKKIVDIEV